MSTIPCDGVHDDSSSDQLILEDLVGVDAVCSAPVSVACLAWWTSAAQVVPATAAQVSDTDVQSPDLQEVGQQPVSAIVAEETDDEVEAGLTLSHDPGQEV